MTDQFVQSVTQDTSLPIQWSDRYLLGHAQMDELHEEFVDIIACMQRAPDCEMEHLLDELLKHARQHFGEEDGWMIATEFPPRECHINEHAAVLASIEQIRSQAELGIYVFCRPFVDELARWFPGHADHLDSALSHWLNKIRLGGKPIVIRRNLF